MDAQHHEKARRALAVIFVLGALYATVVGSLWFMADFVATSVYSPNLDEAQQVSDFNDLAYISQSLRGYRFRLGAEALVMAIALLALAVAVVNRENSDKPIYIAGGVALFCEALLLSHGFALSFTLLFIATATALFLATELNAAREVAQGGLIGAADSTGSLVEDEITTAPVPSAANLDDADEDETNVHEPSLPLQAFEDEAGTEPVIPTQEPEEVVVIKPDDAADTASVEALGLEIESDMNLDLEPDYQLARSADDEQDPLVLLSQADLGIEQTPTIETAADIEREVGVDVSLDMATTAEIKAFIGLADDDVIKGEASEVAEPDAEVVTLDAGRSDESEDAGSSLDFALDESGAETAPSEVDIDSEPVILTGVADGEAIEATPPEFDPEELARQETLLPPPRQKVWNLLDWSILGVIALSIIALIVFYQ